MDPRIEAWRRPRSDVEAAHEDVEHARALTPEERVAEAAALSRMALSFLGRLPPSERRRLLFEQEPLDARHEAALRELVRRSRGR